VLSIQTIAGHTLFSCTVGDLGHLSGIGDVSLDSWACLERMMTVVKRTGHSSYYVEKGIGAMGKTPKELGLQHEVRVTGGAFPIWLENGHCCPIAIVACYSGSSYDDHHLAAAAVKDYLNKLRRTSDSNFPQDSKDSTAVPVPPVAPRDSTVPSEWIPESGTNALDQGDGSPFDQNYES